MGSVKKIHGTNLPEGFHILTTRSFIQKDPELELCRFYNSCSDTKSSLCNGYDRDGNHKSLRCLAYQDRIDLEKKKLEIQHHGKLSELESQEAIDEGADPMITSRVIRAAYRMTSRVDTSTPCGFLEKPYEVIDKAAEGD